MRPSQAMGLAILVTAFAAITVRAHDKTPSVAELKAFLGVAIDDPEFEKFANDEQLKNSYKFDEGIFSPEDRSFRFLYRKNRIEKIQLSIRRPEKSHFKTFTAELPSMITADDDLQKVIERCGQPDYVSATKDKSHVVAGFDMSRLIVVFKKDRVTEIWLSHEPFNLKVPEDRP